MALGIFFFWCKDVFIVLSGENFSEFSVYFAVGEGVMNPRLCSRTSGKRGIRQSRVVTYRKLKNIQVKQKIVEAVALSDIGLLFVLVGW